MVRRTHYLRRLDRLFRQFRVVCILGARQVGKTTLARQYAASGPGPVARYDLEDPDDLARLADPMLELRGRKGLIVIDEVQRRPDLFPALRVLADERPRRSRFLLLGSASPHLLRQSSETLAGRIAYLELAPFVLAEAAARSWERLWLRGGFPESFLARTDGESVLWRRRFRQTFVERDVPALGIPFSPSPVTLARFWAMLAHVHGGLLNWSELGRSMGVSDLTVRRYVDVLEGALVVRQLRPWHESLGKRLVKAPKLYFRDSGMLHVQLGIHSAQDLATHPRVGASWEGFLLEQVVWLTQAEPEDCFFWRTHHGAEIDLVVVQGRLRRGFELKRTSAPTLTPSMRDAVAGLRLDRLLVVHAGAASFPMAPRVDAVGWRELAGALRRK